MTGRVQPPASPPLRVIAPYFLVAPAGLAGAGVIVLGLSGDELAGYNHPHVLATVHALVLGWVTLTMLGASYQLGAAVLGIRSVRPRLLQVQLVAHVVGVALLILAFRAWDLDWLHWAPGAVLLSIGIHAWVFQAAFRPSLGWTATRTYMLVSNVALIVTVVLGALWAQMLSGGAIEVTASRIAAHAHLGLVGWLSLTVMGVFYQLVPMFMLVRSNRRWPWRAALGLIVPGLTVFALASLFDLGTAAWFGGVLVMAAGSAVWFADQVLALRSRRRRAVDHYFVSIATSLVFMAAAVVLGVVAAVDVAADGLTSFGLRLLQAYFVAGVVGWMGTAIVANSYKIVPFIVWYHRYSGRAGESPVPVLADMYHHGLARVVVAVHVAATVALMVAVLARSDALLVVAGVALIAAAGTHEVGMLDMFRERESTRAAPGTRQAAAQ